MIYVVYEYNKTGVKIISRKEWVHVDYATCTLE